MKEGTELSKIGEFRLLYAGIPGLGISVHGEGSPWLPRPLPEAPTLDLVLLGGRDRTEWKSSPLQVQEAPSGVRKHGSRQLHGFYLNYRFHPSAWSSCS